MKNSLRQFETRSRAAFTLVEMLVAVGILVVLTTLTVTAFTVNDADRVGNSVATFKNALEGARSRAINSGEVRGLRLILDANSPRMVKSMVYVGSAGTDEGTGRLIFDSSAATPRWVFVNANRTNWETLFDRELISRGQRIEIPTNSGKWYTITGTASNVDIDGSGSLPAEFEVVTLAGHYQPSVPSGTSSFTAIPAVSVPFRVELAPTILDGAEPILLDPQTCIDLDGSAVPVSWRPGTDQSDTDPTNDDIYGQNSTTSPATITPLDILFGPDGTITGNIRTEGVLRLHFAYVSDVILSEQLTGRPIFQNTASGTILPIVPANPEKDHKAVSIFSQTGGIVITEIDPTTSGTAGGFNSNIASQPFSYALRGQESN